MDENINNTLPSTPEQGVGVPQPAAPQPPQEQTVQSPLAVPQSPISQPQIPVPASTPPKKSKGKFIIIALIFILLLAIAGGTAGFYFYNQYQNEQFKKEVSQIDKQVASLSPSLGDYFTVISYSKEKKASLRKTWQDTVSNTESLLAKHPNNFDLELQLGQLYIYGHNIDEKGAFNKAVEHLTKASTLNPTAVDPHGYLGTLYVNTDPRYAQLAEVEFLTAEKYATKQQMPGVLSGLVFAYSYQGKYSQVITAADEFLKYTPNDPLMMRMKQIAEEKMADGSKLKVFHVN